MRIFAIADLHLGFGCSKPMDMFGHHWKNHAESISTAWRNKVSPSDVVLIGGDISWAMRHNEVQPDLEWLSGLPGTKVMVKGNHDYWFPSSHAKRRAILGDHMIGLYKTSTKVGNVVVVGGKGPDYGHCAQCDERQIKEQRERQIRHLHTSIEHAGNLRKQSTQMVALLHHPPVPPGMYRSEVTDLLKQAGVRLCCYGHIHTPEEHRNALNGEQDGIVYRLVSADYLGFSPFDVTSDLDLCLEDGA